MFNVVWFVVFFFIVFLKYVEVELFNIILFVNCKSEVRRMQVGIARVCSIVFIKHLLTIVSLAIVSVSYCVSSYCIVDDIKDCNCKQLRSVTTLLSC